AVLRDGLAVLALAAVALLPLGALLADARLRQIDRQEVRAPREEAHRAPRDDAVVPRRLALHGGLADAEDDPDADLGVLLPARDDREPADRLIAVAALLEDLEVLGVDRVRRGDRDAGLDPVGVGAERLIGP